MTLRSLLTLALVCVPLAVTAQVGNPRPTAGVITSGQVTFDPTGTLCDPASTTVNAALTELCNSGGGGGPLTPGAIDDLAFFDLALCALGEVLQVGASAWICTENATQAELDAAVTAANAYADSVAPQDDVTDDNVETMLTAGADGTAPVASSGTLVMTDIATQAELDTRKLDDFVTTNEAEFEAVHFPVTTPGETGTYYAQQTAPAVPGTTACVTGDLWDSGNLVQRCYDGATMDWRIIDAGHQWFNVQDYGAVADAVEITNCDDLGKNCDTMPAQTNNRLAFNAATDAACAAGGGTIYIPEGDYRIGGDIATIYDSWEIPCGNLVIRGDGRDLSRLFAEGDTDATLAAGQFMVAICADAANSCASKAVRISNIEIRDLSFLDDNAIGKCGWNGTACTSSEETHGPKIDSVDNLVIDNVGLYGLGDEALNFQYTRNATLTRIHCTGSSIAGTCITPQHGSWDFTIADSTFDGGSRDEAQTGTFINLEAYQSAITNPLSSIERITIGPNNVFQDTTLTKITTADDGGTVSATAGASVVNFTGAPDLVAAGVTNAGNWYFRITPGRVDGEYIWHEVTAVSTTSVTVAADFDAGISAEDYELFDTESTYSRVLGFNYANDGGIRDVTFTGNIIDMPNPDPNTVGALGAGMCISSTGPARAFSENIRIVGNPLIRGCGIEFRERTDGLYIEDNPDWSVHNLALYVQSGGRTYVRRNNITGAGTGGLVYNGLSISGTTDTNVFWVEGNEITGFGGIDGETWPTVGARPAFSPTNADRYTVRILDNVIDSNVGGGSNWTPIQCGDADLDDDTVDDLVQGNTISGGIAASTQGTIRQCQRIIENHIKFSANGIVLNSYTTALATPETDVPKEGQTVIVRGNVLYDELTSGTDAIEQSASQTGALIDGNHCIMASGSGKECIKDAGTNAICVNNTSTPPGNGTGAATITCDGTGAVSQNNLVR